VEKSRTEEKALDAIGKAVWSEGMGEVRGRGVQRSDDPGMCSQ
jgi:hypothetical protein